MSQIGTCHLAAITYQVVNHEVYYFRQYCQDSLTSEASFKLLSHFAYGVFLQLVLAENTLPVWGAQLASGIGVQQTVESTAKLVPEKKHSVGIVIFHVVVTPQLVWQIVDMPLVGRLGG